MRQPPDPARRRLLQLAAGPSFAAWVGTPPLAASAAEASRFARVRPGHADWPDAAAWRQFGGQLASPLLTVQSPWPGCRAAPASAACADIFRKARNPYYLGDEVALTQTLGWV
ncbi:MAG: FAD-binding oxidoreductase, partial [Ramlibacter sp.]|nr:FAD-binding oxidoreductase [Ramlibacter sp.]